MTTHRVPPHTVLLGDVLEAEIDTGDARIVVTEWAGMMLLAPADATEREPGYGRLYCAPAPKSLKGGEPTHGRGVRTYVEWHRREPRHAPEVTVPAKADRMAGRCVRLDYRSDKWDFHGRTREYTHSFTDGGELPPLMFINRTYLEDATLVVLSGGEFVVRREGIA